MLREWSRWIGPRDGTAKALLGDFNPFRIVQVDLVRGQSVRRTATYEALRDTVAEPTESFELVARTWVRNAGTAWHERQDRMIVLIKETTPPPPSAAPSSTVESRVSSRPCYACGG